MDLLSTLSSTYRQSAVAIKFSSVNGTDQAGNPSAPYLEMIGTLRALKTNDPLLYQRITREVNESMRAKADSNVDVREFVKCHKTTLVRSVANGLKYRGEALKFALVELRTTLSTCKDALLLSNEGLPITDAVSNWSDPNRAAAMAARTAAMGNGAIFETANTAKTCDPGQSTSPAKNVVSAHDPGGQVAA